MAPAAAGPLPAIASFFSAAPSPAPLEPSPRPVKPRVVTVRCLSITLRYTLSERLLQKSLMAAVVAPFLKAYNAKVDDDLTLEDLVSISIDGRELTTSQVHELLALDALPNDSNRLEIQPESRRRRQSSPRARLGA